MRKILLSGNSRSPGVGRQLEKLKDNARVVVAGDESAATLMTNNEILGLHLVERLARGAGGNAEIGRDFMFARNGLARLPCPVVDAAHEHIARLPVERTEAERVASFHAAHALQRVAPLTPDLYLIEEFGLTRQGTMRWQFHNYWSTKKKTRSASWRSKG